MNAPSVILEARDIELRRNGRTTLAVPHLAVHEGEVLAVLGPNGAGKSSLLLTLATLLKPHAGKVLFKGKGLNNPSSILTYRRSIAMVFQEPLLLSTSVFNNVASGLRLRGVSGSDIKRIVPRALSRFHITALANRSARTLSGGEAQRTSLARAFVVQPRILFLDEPFSSLDQPTREALIQDLKVAIEETKTTVLFATHHLDEALRLSDRIAVVQNGTIVQLGRTEDVLNSPCDEFVASFIGMETVLWGKVVKAEQGIVTLAVGNRLIAVAGDALPGEDILIGVRPENVILSTTPHADGSSARNVFSALVTGIIPKGFFYRITLDCGFPLAAYITSHSRNALNIQEGSNVTASFKATAVHVIRKKA